VEICGINTSKLPTLSEDKKRELFEKIKNGDAYARQEFIYGNLRLVLSVMQKFNNRGECADDLFQIGCIGLIKALDNFDTSHGVKFSTYAVPMIIGEIRRYLRDNNALRVSRSLRDIAYKALAVKERLISETSKEPTNADIARELGVKTSEVDMALDAIMDPVSLNEPVYHDSGDAVFVMDQVKDEKNTDERWLDEISLSQAIDRLPEREKNIISMRFFHGKTQMEIAEEIGISQAQVSRLEKNAINHMKKHL
jgi:RNA polymerase sporulation-specific sigma factor